jgi:phenylalanyl-tRNA synthetase alpha chain
VARNPFVLKEKLEQLMTEGLAAFKAAKDAAALEALEIQYLGRKGEMNALMQGMAGLPGHARPAMGKLANEVKVALERALSERRRELEVEKLGAIATSEWIDLTAPGFRPPQGHVHLVTDAIAAVTEIFSRIGFTRVRHPEVEWDWYAFESLNMPKDHPARDEWETFFVDAPEHPKLGKMVLTPHTSSGQVREMQKGKLPIRMIDISKTYRRQSDVTHVPMFHQFEGLMIDRKVAVTHLKGVLDHFAREFFGPGRKTRLRPFHFRFTEPSFEIDITCDLCGGTGVLPASMSSASLRGPDDSVNVRSSTPPSSSSPRLASDSSAKARQTVKCRLCKEGWLELGGAGMVHPNVLKAGGVDPEEWSGFAFGWGVERTMMMREGLKIDDIRLLYRNDFRFLRQF